MTDTTQPPAETLAAAKARAAKRAASGDVHIEGSIYEGMAACLTRHGATIAHVVKYEDAVEIAAALTRRAGGDAILAGEVEIRAITAQMRRFMPNACGDWADKIDAALETEKGRKVAFYDEGGIDIRPGESLADRDRRIYQQGRHDALNDEPEAFI